MSKPFITRFAPSPTGLLHLGHAYSAVLAFKASQRNSGHFLVRIEDIDQTRARPEFEKAILEDLAWLGLNWEEPVRRQSDHFESYRKKLKELSAKGLLYRCFCTRREIRQEIEKSQSAPHGPEGPLYPGTCRNLSRQTIAEKLSEETPYALRLNVEKALRLTGKNLFFREKGKPVKAKPQTLGDVVLARKDTPTSYHLSVVIDDEAQKVSHIVRGKDLLHSTHIHCLLQNLLGFRSPEYHHHNLLKDKDGNRFAKRDKSLTLKSLRDAGQTPESLIKLMEQFGADFSELPF